MITGINVCKTLTLYVDLMENNVIQINGGITINVGVSVKNVMYVKNTIFGILLDAVIQMENIKQILWNI